MAEQQAPEQQAQPQFSIEKLYIKDISLESPNTPELFLERSAPQVELKLQNQARQAGEGLYEVLLTVTLTAKVGERTAYLVEVAQAGLFRVLNVSEDMLGMILQITCPTVLFPYAREAVSDLIGRAGFQPIYLAPVNFEQLYQQQQAQAAAPAPEPSKAS
jgi:preprotein translocase subunit SecB